MKYTIASTFTAFFFTINASIGIIPIDQAFADDVRPLPSVTVSKVMEGEIVDRVPISGTLVAKEEVLVFPQVSGYSVEKIHYDIGDTVQRGDILSELNSQTLKAQFSQAEAEFARADAAVRQAISQVESSQAAVVQADAALDRSEQLRKSGTTTQASLDQSIAAARTANANLTSVTIGVAVAEAQRQQSVAQLEIARVNLEHAKIISPVNGLISARNIQLGAIATSGGEPNFRIIADGIIEVKAEIIETALGSVKVNNRVELNIAGIGPVLGSVRLISPAVDPTSRLGMIRLKVEASPQLRTGLFASGWLIVDKRTSMIVPNRAVLTSNQDSFVLAIDKDGIIKRTKVDVGTIWSDQREVLGGLELDQTIITKAGAFFADGDQIKPVFEDNTQNMGTK